MKILVIDDSQLDRSLIIEMLKENGLKSEFLEATNGDNAIEILGRNYKEIKLILLDWQMPEMSGLEFLQAISKVAAVAGIPIVMVTVASTEKDKKQAHEANPHLYGYVVKPFTSETLMKTIKNLITLSGHKTYPIDSQSN